MIGPPLLKMLMPERGRIDVSGETGLAWTAGGQTELKQKAPSWEEAFYFRQCGLDRGSVFIDVRRFDAWQIHVGRSLPQYLQTIALALMISAQNGHSLVESDWIETLFASPSVASASDGLLVWSIDDCGEG